MAERKRDQRRATPGRVIAPLLGVLCFVLAVLYPLNPLSKGAERYAGKVAAASAVTYVSLRTLNAFLSTAQEAEVGLSVGASASIQPLKTLEPIDDTIERIASVVFSIMVVSGVLAIAMGPVAAIGFVMAGIGLLVIFVARKPRLGRRLSLYGAFFAIALPLAYSISGGLAELMTKRTWDENQRIVTEITQGVDHGAAKLEEQPEEGWLSGLLEQGNAIADYRAMAARVVQDADKLIGSYIDLLAVLLFNLILLPVVLVGGVFVVFRWVANEGWA